MSIKTEQSYFGKVFYLDRKSSGQVFVGTFTPASLNSFIERAMNPHTKLKKTGPDEYTVIKKKYYLVINLENQVCPTVELHLIDNLF
jgi:hypothetical protein